MYCYTTAIFFTYIIIISYNVTIIFIPCYSNVIVVIMSPAWMGCGHIIVIVILYYFYSYYYNVVRRIQVYHYVIIIFNIIIMFWYVMIILYKVILIFISYYKTIVMILPIRMYTDVFYL